MSKHVHHLVDLLRAEFGRQRAERDAMIAAWQSNGAEPVLYTYNGWGCGLGCHESAATFALWLAEKDGAS